MSPPYLSCHHHTFCVTIILVISPSYILCHYHTCHITIIHFVSLSYLSYHHHTFCVTIILVMSPSYILCRYHTCQFTIIVMSQSVFVNITVFLTSYLLSLSYLYHHSHTHVNNSMSFTPKSPLDLCHHHCCVSTYISCNHYTCYVIPSVYCVTKDSVCFTPSVSSVTRLYFTPYVNSVTSQCVFHPICQQCHQRVCVSPHLSTVSPTSVCFTSSV